MALNRNITEVIGALTPKQAERAVNELNARRDALGTWDKVAFSLHDKFNPAYLWQVGAGRKKPSRRLLLALGVVKPEKRSGIRVRMSVEEATELLKHGRVMIDLENRLRYALWGRK